MPKSTKQRRLETGEPLNVRRTPDWFLDADNREYWKARRRIAIEIMDKLGVAMSPVDCERLIKEADTAIRGVYAEFYGAFKVQAAQYLIDNPDRARAPIANPNDARETMNSHFPRDERTKDMLAKKNVGPANEPESQPDLPTEANADPETQATRIEVVQTRPESDITIWTNVIVNGHLLSVTARNGVTPVEISEAIFAFLDGLSLVKNDARVVQYGASQGDARNEVHWFKQPKKAGESVGEAPAENKPITNKPSAPAGKGETKQQKCTQIRRVMNEDGTTYSYKLPFNLKNGEQSKYPHLVVNARDVEALEKALREAGYAPEDFAIGSAYDLPIIAEWEVGAEIPRKDPSAPVKHYRDHMRFEIGE